MIVRSRLATSGLLERHRLDRQAASASLRSRGREPPLIRRSPAQPPKHRSPLRGNVGADRIEGRFQPRFPAVQSDPVKAQNLTRIGFRLRCNV